MNNVIFSYVFRRDGPKDVESENLNLAVATRNEGRGSL